MKEISYTVKVLSINQIIDCLEQNRTILQTFGVKKIGLFGSYRRGSARANSDMDFIVQLNRSTFDSYMDLKIFLEDLFHCEIDLVLEDSLKPGLRPYILPEVIYASGF